MLFFFGSCFFSPLSGLTRASWGSNGMEMELNRIALRCLELNQRTNKRINEMSKRNEGTNELNKPMYPME